MAHIVILGGGLTGLSVAYHLERAGFFDYVIYEREDRPGGLLRSFEVDGFTFDFTGHLLHINDPYFTAFVSDITSLDRFLSVTRKAAIFSHNTITPYPFQMNLFGLPPEVAIDCIKGFLRRRSDIRKPKNFYEWVLKYFGRGMGEHFFFPYNSKILAYDIKKVLPSWTGRFVPQTSLDAVLKGALVSSEAAGVGYNSKFFYPKKGGIEFLIRALRSRLQNNIVTGANAVQVDASAKKVFFENGTSASYEKLVSTLPLDQLLQRVSASNRTYGQAAKKLICNTTYNFNLAFNQPELSDKHWLYYPEKEYPFYRLGFWHNINPASVRPGYSAIYGELSYQPSSTPPHRVPPLVDRAIATALKTLGLREQDIMLRKDLVLQHAYVLYDAWREKNLPRLHASLNKDDIFSIGRFGAWKYSSMQEAVLDGKEVAAELLVSSGQRASLKGLVQPSV